MLPAPLAGLPRPHLRASDGSTTPSPPPTTWPALDDLSLLGQPRGAIECGAGQGLSSAAPEPSRAAPAANHRAPAAKRGYRLLDAADSDAGRR